MKFKKLGVLCGAMALLLAIAAPAFAQSASISGIGNGQTIVGDVTIRGNATADPGTNVRHLELIVNGSVVRAEDYSGIKQNATVEYGWSTASLRNGEYAIIVNANFSGGGSASDTYRVYVDNPPGAPSGVSAANNAGTITVSWAANAEADISGYRLERDSGSGWASVGQTYNTSMSDKPGPGSHSYRVIALRYSPTQGTKASAPSAATSVTVAGGSGGSTESGGYYQDEGGYYQGGSGSGTGANGSGNSIPGYGPGANGGKGGKGSKGTTGKGSGNPWDLIFNGGRSIGGLGLPGGLTLPGSGGLSPRVQDSIDWGTYSEDLPYELGSSTGGTTPEEFLGGRTAARWDYNVIPPDGLRWVAAGLLLFVAAALLKFLERRIAAPEVDAAETAAAIVETSKEGGAVSFKTAAASSGTRSTGSLVESSTAGDGVSFKTSAKAATQEDDAA